MQVDAVRALLPWWVGVSNVLAFVAVLALVATLVMGVSQRMTLRHYDAAAPWTERARVAAVARSGAGRTFLLVLSLAVIFALWREGPLSWLSGGVLAALAFVVSFEIAGRFGYARERRLLGAWLDRAQWRRGTRSFFWLSWSPAVVTMLMLFLTPGDFGVWTWVVLGGGAATLLWLFDDGVFRVLRARGLIRPAPPEVGAIIEQACTAAGRAPAKAQVLESWSSNAFAQPHRDTITFTSRALELLSPAEILAVAHHEVGHLREAGLVRGRRWLVMPLLVALGAMRPIVAAFDWVGAVVVFVVIFVVVQWVTHRSRRSERAADAHAHGHADDPATYVRALEKLHEHNLVPAVQRGKRHSHPDLWDRMQAAGVQPAWPRPAPPGRDLGASAITFLILLVVVVASASGLRTLDRAADREVTAAYWSLALTAGDDRALGTLGRAAYEAGRMAEAELLLEAALALDPRRLDHGIGLARALGRQGRVEEAIATLDALAARGAEAKEFLEFVDAVRTEVEGFR